MTGKELVKNLQRDDWKIDRIHGSHIIMEKDGKTVSVPVHSGKDLKPGTLNTLLKITGIKR